MTDSIEIEYKGVEFYVEYDIYQEDDNRWEIDCINVFEHKGTCFSDFLDEETLEDVYELIDEATKKRASI
jgi:hypothetical protein